ncbi:sulfotransferase family protein [Streptomyces sp. NPDC019443]|uniref:sulfotransferase family protein n=1 Tax=Streptomyces sp. NPDC019443 TaxID=3365061 RepID=UPI00379DB35E
MPAPMQEPDLARALGRFIAEAFRLVALDPLRPVLCEKTPSNAQYVRRLQLLLPESRVVVMVRDPMAVALSHTQRDWGPTDPVEAAAYTAAYFRCWREFAPHAQNCFVVRHEDLVAEPARTLSAVIRFLGLRQDAAWLRCASDEIRPSTDRVGALPDVVAAQMRARLAEEAREFGYPVVSGAR